MQIGFKKSSSREVALLTAVMALLIQLQPQIAER